MIDFEWVLEQLKVRGEYLFHRENQELEFKEQFNLGGLADYFRDFSAFANNRGGYLIFGVKDSPRLPIGLSPTSLDQFARIDPEKITGFLLEIFSSDIEWAQSVIEMDGKYFGIFRVLEAKIKPVIAKKDEGKDQIIKNGEIYYRYGGRTQKIQFAELENIISKRIEQNNQQWLDLMQKIGKAGPQNAAILDTEKALIEKEESKILVLDEDLASKLKFIKEGQFSEKEGAPTLKLVGDIVPVEQLEVVKRIKENLTKSYPLSALELASEIQKQLPDIKRNQIWQAITETGIKNNADYAAYNFRNKKQEDHFRSHGTLPAATPIIYNFKAVTFLVKILQNGIMLQES